MKRILFSTAALIAIIAAAPASATDNNDIINGQINLSGVWAGMDMEVYDSGYVEGTAAAIGNSLSAELGGDSEVANTQRTSGLIESSLNASVDWTDDVSLTSAAVGNTATILSEPYLDCDVDDCPYDDASLELTNRQYVNYDPSANLSIYANGVGHLNGTAAAIGNSLSVEAWNHENDIDTRQVVNDDINSYVGAAISGADSVSLTSAAVGNTVSIDNLMD